MNSLAFEWIEAWLGAISDPTTTISSKTHNLSTSDDHWAQMTPPPSGATNSSGVRPGGSPKRQKLDSPEPDNDDAVMQDQNVERTPRSRQSRPLDHSSIPMRGIGHVPSLPPSQSSHASYAGAPLPPSEASLPRPEGSPTRGRRCPARSLAKSANSLRAMEFPVVHVALGNSPLEILPQEVHDLFQSVHDITMDHESFIPFEIKDFIKATVFGAKDRWFMPPLQPSSTNDTEGDRWTGVPMSPTRIAVAELDTLRDIEAKAGDCELRGCAEFTWNLRVHDPLLLHALSGHPTIHVEPSQVARIATQFIPSTGGRGGGNIIESKMIDYCLTLRFNQGMPDQSLEDTLGSDARLMDAISRRVWAQPSDSQTFNQTLYDPLQFCPIACSIETKNAASNGDGKLQLSVWVAAWYKRMQKLLPDGSPMVTLPLIRVMGHSWILLFAVHRGHRIEIIGEHEIGNTSTLMGIYEVNAVLRKMADWIDTSYRGWLEHVLLD